MKGAGSKNWIWDSTNEEWVKQAGTAEGAMSIHAIVEELNDIEDVNVPAPGDGEGLVWDAGTSKWIAAAVGVTAHKDTHDPQDGSDPLDTAAPVKVGEANATGTSHSLARADHVHEKHHAKYTDAEAKAQAEGAKLDAHAAPDDTTTNDATAALHGLMPKASVTKLAGIDTGADVTGDNAPQAHAASHDFLGSDEGSFHQGLITGSRLFLFDGNGHDDAALWTKNTNGTGSITPGIMNTVLATGATNGSDATFRTTAGGWGLSTRYVKWELVGISQTNCDIWIWVSRTDGAQAPVNTEQYAGFLTTNGRLWCYSSDGAVNEATDTGLDDVDGTFVIKIATTAAYFWLNGVLLATHETRVPTNTNHYVKCRIDNTAAADKSCRIVNICHA